MKKLLILAIVSAFTILSACSSNEDRNVNKEENEAELNENVVQSDFIKEELDDKFGTDEIYIVKTYTESPAEDIQKYIDDGDIFITVRHYQLSDGTWKTDEHSYKYMLKITGRLNNAVKDSTYLVLANRDDITFDEAWKASGLSSNYADYFNPEDAIIVGKG